MPWHVLNAAALEAGVVPTGVPTATSSVIISRLPGYPMTDDTHFCHVLSVHTATILEVPRPIVSGQQELMALMIQTSLRTWIGTLWYTEPWTGAWPFLP